VGKHSNRGRRAKSTTSACEKRSSLPAEKGEKVFILRKARAALLSTSRRVSKSQRFSNHERVVLFYAKK